MRMVILVGVSALVMASMASCAGGGCWGVDCSVLGEGEVMGGSAATGGGTAASATGGGSATSGGAASCTDANGVCIEVVGGSQVQVDALLRGCATEGKTPSRSGCRNCQQGTRCLGATLTATGTGVRFKGNICYGVDFCRRFPNVDTGGSCVDIQKGTPVGPQCARP